jgi:hypothetical protein
MLSTDGIALDSFVRCPRDTIVRGMECEFAGRGPFILPVWAAVWAWEGAMAAQVMLDDDAAVMCEHDEADGLLAYLQTLCRVANAPDESHWCTPGHNRGRALERPACGLAVLGNGRVSLPGAAGTPRVAALRGLARSWWDMPHVLFDRAEA